MNKEECIDIINPPYLSIRGNIICSLDDFKKYAIDLQTENTKLKQEKEDLIKWLKEEIKWCKAILKNGCCDLEKKNFIYYKSDIDERLIVCKETLYRLGETQ